MLRRIRAHGLAISTIVSQRTLRLVAWGAHIKKVENLVKKENETAWKKVEPLSYRDKYLIGFLRLQMKKQGKDRWNELLQDYDNRRNQDSDQPVQQSSSYDSDSD